MLLHQSQETWFLGVLWPVIRGLWASVFFSVKWGLKSHLQWFFIDGMNVVLWTGIMEETVAQRRGADLPESRRLGQPRKASRKRQPGAETHDRSAPGSRPADSGPFFYFAHIRGQMFREIRQETAYGTRGNRRCPRETWVLLGLLAGHPWTHGDDQITLKYFHTSSQTRSDQDLVM